MKKWKKVPDELVELLDARVSRFKPQRRTMFGCPCFFVNGNMFAGAHEDNVILRLSDSDRREIMEDFDEVGPFEPMKGRRMREYVALPGSVHDDTEVLDEWLERAHAFARKLPSAGKASPTKKTTRRKKQ